MRNAYSEKIRARNKELNTEAPGDTQPTFEQAAQKMGVETASESAQQGNLLGTMGGGLMMTGNPYAMAAGLGLQVYAAGEQNKRAAEEKQRMEYNKRIARRQQMMNKIAQMRIE